MNNGISLKLTLSDRENQKSSCKDTNGQKSKEIRPLNTGVYKI